MMLSQVLPQAYGGAAAMIPIENAVHARLVREGLERSRTSPDSEASEHAPDAEGRLTRAGRCSCLHMFASQHLPLLRFASSRSPHHVPILCFEVFSAATKVVMYAQCNVRKGIAQVKAAFTGVGVVVLW